MALFDQEIKSELSSSSNSSNSSSSSSSKPIEEQTKETVKKGCGCSRGNKKDTGSRN